MTKESEDIIGTTGSSQNLQEKSEKSTDMSDED